MPRNAQRRSNRLRQAIYVVGAVFVLFYVLFDVLDLDGSNFHLKTAPAEKALMTAELPLELKHAHSAGKAEAPLQSPDVLSIGCYRTEPFPFARVSIFTPPHLSRSRHYRIGLPRSCTNDSSSPSL